MLTLGYNITVKYADNGTTFSIPYYFFNFEDHIRVRDLLEAFLSKLKAAGCFEDYKRGPATFGGSDMIFSKVDLGALKKYRNALSSNTNKDKRGVIKERGVEKESNQSVLKPPQGWLLIKSVKNPQIKRGNKIVYEFPTNWSNKYKYFKCLWINYRNPKPPGFRKEHIKTPN